MTVLLQLVLCVFISIHTIVKVDPKASFSIATTPRCRGGRGLVGRVFTNGPGTWVQS